MLIEVLKTIYKRELNRLKKEIESYENENNLWVIEKSISNSGGNLCLHLVGNLNTFIGEGLGKTGYVRKRDLEFSLKDVPRSELITQVEDVINVIEKTFDNLPEEDLQKESPNIFHYDGSIEFMLVYLASHLSYHLGQINYHRRVLDN